MCRSTVGSRCTLVLALLLLTPTPSHAQSWALVDALGYGAAGVGAGVLIDSDLSAFSPTLLLGGAGGILFGARVGRSADTRLARGDELGNGHKAAVVAGSVLAGTALGALASAALITGGESGQGTFLASDETTFTVLTVAGTALGVAGTWWRRDALRPRSMSVTPTVSAESGVGVRVRVQF